MRTWHRWISTLAMLLLGWVAVTGVVLAVDSMYPPAGLDGPPGGAAQISSAAGSDAVAPLDAEQLEPLLLNSLRTALANNTAPASVDVQLQSTDATPRARVALGSGAERIINVDAQNGKVISIESQRQIATQPWYRDVSTRLRLHDLLQDLHRGTIIGLPGQLLDILTGLSFAFLTISGAVMYFQMLARRRTLGRRQWFWS